MGVSHTHLPFNPILILVINIVLLLVKTMPKQNKQKDKSQPSKGTVAKTASRRNNPPVAINRSMKTQAPKHGLGDHDVKSHRECVRSFTTDDIKTYSEGFDNMVPYVCFTLSINPGLKESFPWLYTQAQGYESYKFTHLKYEWVPSCPTSTPGSVLLAIDFDPMDPVPSDAKAMSNYQGAVRSDVWSPVTMVANMKDSRNAGEFRFVRSSLSSTEASQLPMYDLGNMFLSFPDMLALPEDATPLGTLYVDFTVEFKTPQVSGAGAGSTFEGRHVFVQGSKLYTTTDADMQAGSTTIGTPDTFLDCEYALLTGNQLLSAIPVYTGDKIDATEATWPIQFYREVLTSVDMTANEVWTYGCQALTATKMVVDVGPMQTDVWCQSTTVKSTKPTVANDVLGYWVTEVAIFNPNRREILSNAIVDGSDGSPQVSGGYITGVTSEWAGEMTSLNGAPRIHAEIELPLGCWLLWHTIVAQYEQPGTTSYITLATDETASASTGTDLPWWQVALKALPTILDVVIGIASIFLLPGAIQKQLKEEHLKVKEINGQCRKDGNWLTVMERVAVHPESTVTSRSTRLTKYFQRMGPENGQITRHMCKEPKKNASSSCK